MNYTTTFAALVIAMNTTAQGQNLKPEWELGVIGLATSQQAYPGSSNQTSAGLIAPLLIYRGKFLRAGQGGIGLRAIDLPNFEIDIGFAGSFGSKSNKIPVRQGMPNLGNLVEFGPRAKWYLNGRNTDQTSWLELPIRGVFDISNQAKNIGYTAEPQWAYQTNIGAWKLSGSLGALLGNQNVNQYFYSVDTAYANSTRNVYQAKSGLVAVKMGFNASYQISPTVSLFSFARLNTTRIAANHVSPLIDKASGTSYGIGIIYSFLQSEALVSP
jgi:MipA family protein